MRQFALVVISVLWASFVTAQPIEVRSGAHDDFTRLVLHMPARAAFKLARSGRDVRITFKGSEREFRTDRVFDRIGRGRVKSVVPIESGLRLGLACDCKVKATWAGTAMLAIDISGPASPETLAVTVRAAERSGAKTFSTPLGPVTGAWPSSATDLVAAGLLDRRDSLPEQEADSPDEPAPQKPPTRSQLADWEESLLRDVVRASGQNLLSFRPAASTRSLRSPNSEQDEDVPIAPSENESVNDTSLLPGSVTTMQPKTPPGASLSDGTGCAKIGRIDVAQWGNESPFSQQLAEYRRRLGGELDQIDPAIVLELARLYVFFGFGAEAQQVLDLASLDSSDTQVLAELAEIMDKGFVQGQSLFAHQLDCAGDVSLWVVLAHEVLPADATLHDKEILRTFNGLPKHLVEHLGPILAKRLLDAGFRDLADRVLRRLDRTPVAASNAETLARAEIHLDRLEESLSEVMEGQPAEAAEALLRRIENRLANDRGVTEEMAQLAASYAMQFRETPFAADLTRAYIAAIAASGDLDRAFAEFERLETDLDDTGQARVRDFLLRVLTRDAEDVSFVEKVLRYSDADLAQLREETAQGAAQRLIDLGFHDVASRFATPGDGRNTGKSARLIRARIALARGMPRNAEVELLGLDGPEVNALRAEAREMSGDADGAVRLFASAERGDDVRRVAIEAGDWSRVAEEGEGDLAGLAADLVTPPTTESPDAPLASGRALLEESGQSRDRIRALLSSRPVNDE